MSRDELLTEMEQRRARTLERLRAVPMNVVVYPESGWRVQDVVAHLTHWEEQSLLTLSHALRGERHYLPNFRELGVDGFNALNVEQRRGDSPAMTMQRFADVRARMAALLRAMTPEQYAMTIRWLGSDATPQQLVSGLLWHEDQHVEEVVQRVPQEV